MDRRTFSKLMGAAVTGMAVGAKVIGDPGRAFAAGEEGKAKHVCKGHNECKGQGGCDRPEARSG